MGEREEELFRIHHATDVLADAWKLGLPKDKTPSVCGTELMALVYPYVREYEPSCPEIKRLVNPVISWATFCITTVTVKYNSKK